MRVPFPPAVEEFFCVKWDVLVHSGVLPLHSAGAARRRTPWWHPTWDRLSGPHQEEAWVSVKSESTGAGLGRRGEDYGRCAVRHRLVRGIA